MSPGRDGDFARRDAADPSALHAPFRPPALRSTRTASALLLATRVAMVVWAGSVASALGDDAVTDAGPITSAWVGASIGLAWMASGALWSYLRTINVHRLDGRYPSVARSAVVWTYAPIWVALMVVLVVPADPNPDFDIRPIVIVGGFVLTLLSPYRLVHRVFKSLLRVPPTATCVAWFVVDTMAFGLLWWRATTWSSDEADQLSFDTGVVVAAVVALLIGSALTWYLDRSADAAQQTRIVALRTRHDHRIARLCGLDPMDAATRRALLMVRRITVRTRSGMPVDPETERLVATLAREVEGGVTADFAERVRLLALRTDGLMVAAPVDHESAAERPDGAAPRRAGASRLYLAETLRYVVVALYAMCTAACIALVVGIERDDLGTVDRARGALVWGTVLTNVVAAAWATAVALGARRVGGRAVWRVPLASTVVAAVVAAIWIGSGELGVGPSAVAFVLATAAITAALWRITVLDRQFVVRHADSPLQAWMSVAPAVFGLLLLSPMRTDLDVGEPTGRVVFFATLIGLAAALSGSVAAVAMVQLEDGIRASTGGQRPAIDDVTAMADRAASDPATGAVAAPERVPAPPKPRAPGALTRKEAAARAAAAPTPEPVAQPVEQPVEQPVVETPPAPRPLPTRRRLPDPDPAPAAAEAQPAAPNRPAAHEPDAPPMFPRRGRGGRSVAASTDAQPPAGLPPRRRSPASRTAPDEGVGQAATSYLRSLRSAAMAGSDQGDDGRPAAPRPRPPIAGRRRSADPAEPGATPDPPSTPRSRDTPGSSPRPSGSPPPD